MALYSAGGYWVDGYAEGEWTRPLLPILRPEPRNTQPKGAARINARGELASGLVFAAEASRGMVNLVDGSIGEAIGAGVTYGSGGGARTWQFTGSQGNRSASFGATGLLDGATEATWDILVYFNSANPSAHFFGQWDYALKWLLQASGGYLVWVACDDAGGSRARFDSSGVVFPTAGWYRVIASWRGSAGTSLMVNRVITDRNASGPAYSIDTTTGGDYLQLGTVNGGSPLAGAIAFARVWRRGLPESEMLAVHDHGWRLFAPIQSPRFISLPVGPFVYARPTADVALGSWSGV